MAMNRGDYETLAAAIADSEVDINARRHLAFDIADALTGTAPRFDPVLWLRGCKVGPIEPAEVADWTTRLEARVQSVSAKREQYVQRTGDQIEKY